MQPRCTLIHAVAVVAAAAALLLPPLAAGQPWPTCDASAGTRCSSAAPNDSTGGAGVVAAYDRAVTELLAATVRYAVEENPARLFATGQRVGDDARDPGFRNIYSMAQCSPDLPPASCRRCLDGVLARWWEVFPLNGEGARVAGARCYLRSELGVGPFYTGAPMVVLRADKV
uniref:Gnk2-homologous domain-containing protein n=1 Tax=Oryza barthii TaxID=65489 RepID=A0A0D3FU43_9ORYZ